MPGLQDADQAGSDRRTQFALLSEVPEVKQAADLCGFFLLSAKIRANLRPSLFLHQLLDPVINIIRKSLHKSPDVFCRIQFVVVNQRC